MVTRENRIIAVCVVAAVALIYPISLLDPPDWAGFLAVFAVGVLLPGYLTGRYRA